MELELGLFVLNSIVMGHGKGWPATMSLSLYQLSGNVSQDQGQQTIRLLSLQSRPVIL